MTTSAAVSSTEPAPEAKAEDKLAPFRSLFGMPVAVQFATPVPYIQIRPLHEGGRPVAVQVPNGPVIGLPEVLDPPSVQAVAVGVLRPAPCGTWLIIEERIALRPDGESSLGGQALMDVYVRPDMVTHVTFVKMVEIIRPQRAVDS